MDIGAILWPIIWIWVGAAIGFLGVGALSAARRDRQELDDSAGLPVSVPANVEEISLRHTGVNAWEARLLDGKGSTIVTANGPTPDLALQVAVKEGSRQEYANGVA
jgi:hypothetical protein